MKYPSERMKMDGVAFRGSSLSGDKMALHE